MHPKQYFQYYTNINPIAFIQQQESTHLTSLRPKTSQYSLEKTKKILPHIMEEYQYNITNELLEQKIKNPRRDKIIIQSIAHVTKNKEKMIKRTKKNQNQNRSSQPVLIQKTIKHDQTSRNVNKENLALRIRKPTCEKFYKTFHDMNSSCHNYQNDYLLNLENKRMGKRLINTRSMVQDYLEKTFFTYQFYNGKLANRDKYVKIQRDLVKFKNGHQTFGKINTGIKRFFQQSQGKLNKSYNLNSFSHQQLSAEPNFNTYGYQTNYPKVLKTCGRGQLNFIIKKLQFFSNPPLKSDCMLTIQLYQNMNDLIGILHQKYNNNRQSTVYDDQDMSKIEKRQKNIKTLAFPYEYIISAKQPECGLKFKFNYHKNIILRFLKTDGLRQNELGMMKLDLELMKINNDQTHNIQKKQRKYNKINVQNRQQNVIESNLHRYKKGQISTRVKLHYQLFYTQGQADMRQSKYC